MFVNYNHLLLVSWNNCIISLPVSTEFSSTLSTAYGKFIWIQKRSSNHRGHNHGADCKALFTALNARISLEHLVHPVLIRNGPKSTIWTIGSAY